MPSVKTTTANFNVFESVISTETKWGFEAKEYMTTTSSSGIGNLAHHYQEIIPGLFLGSEFAFKYQLETLVGQHQVRLVIRCLPCQDAEERAALQAAQQRLQQFEHTRVEMFVVPIVDSPDADIGAYLPRATEQLHAALSAPNSAVFVHCQAGISRSSTVVLGYLMRYRGMMLDDALLLCRRKRPVVFPNPGFLFALRELEEEVHLSTADPPSKSLFNVDLFTRFGYLFPGAPNSLFREAWMQAEVEVACQAPRSAAVDERFRSIMRKCLDSSGVAPSLVDVDNLPVAMHRQQSQQNKLSAETSEAPLERSECPNCGRFFSVDRIHKHSAVCAGKRR